MEDFNACCATHQSRFMFDYRGPLVPSMEAIRGKGFAKGCMVVDSWDKLDQMYIMMGRYHTFLFSRYLRIFSLVLRV